jgi:regulation of enolase protein 1 (concanavalin A-like superfamily)
MAATVFVGLAATSHTTSATTTAVADNVSAGAGSPPPPPTPPPSPWAERDIGAVPIPGSTAYSNGTFTVKASGADIWGTADAFHFVYQPLVGDGSIKARVASVTPADNWSKAGVMIRETLDPGSAHAFMLVSAGKGVALQWRPTTGGSSLSAAGSLSAPPRWVRLERSGDTITGSESVDGVTWNVVSTTTIPMAQSVYVGLAATSHTTSAQTTATIDNVSIP